jgi:uncharacterized membrane protein SirB2
MATYLIVKQIHVACVVLSLGGFAARGALMVAGSGLLRTRFVRTAPHVVDTVLLSSALWLAWTIQQYPFVHGWLTAKVLGLIAYIGFGAMALKHGRTLRARSFYLVLALLAAAYVVAVALTRDPAGPIVWLRR